MASTKMSDKKPAKGKAKAKGGGPKPKAKATATESTTAAPASARQPGVERRKSHPLRARAGHFQVILTHAVPFVGQAGELVAVRPGFARNYLLPQGLATFATPHNLRKVEKHRERLRQLEQARRADLMSLASQIGQKTITIEANANEEGHLYGSVNADQIAAALRAERLTVEEANVKIEGPLKETGFYTIKIHLASEIEAELKLWVVPTHIAEETS